MRDKGLLVRSWLVAAVLCGCGRETLSSAVDAGADRPMVFDVSDDAEASGWDDAADAVADARTRDARRDAPLDAPPDGPCPAGFGLCSSGAETATCIDQRTDRNCGACGHVCQVGTTCLQGTCVSSCPAGTSYCPGLPGNACVNLAGSPDHCGRCGHACAAGQTCRESTCQPTCRPTMAWDLPQASFLPNNNSTASVGDLDGDLDLDAAVAWSSSYELWRNQGPGGFVAWNAPLPLLEAGERVSRVSQGDFNGDGRKDLLLALYTEPTGSYVGSLLALVATDKGEFVRSNKIKLATTDSSPGWSVADMNRDGRSDLLIFEPTQIRVWLGQAEGSLKEAGKTAVPSRIYYAQIGDLNGDGHKDVVGVTSDQTKLQVFLGAGDGRLAPAVESTMPEEGTPLVVADPDGDGHPSLLVGTKNGALLLQGTKEGGITQPQVLESDSLVYAAVFFDLDQDGKLDFIRGTQNQEMRISYGRGDGSFGAPLRYAFPRGTPINVGDFDGDGRNDLAVYISYARVLYTMRGRDTGFPGFRILENQAAVDDGIWASKDLVQADLNEDGVPDLVTLNTKGLEVALGGGVDAGAVAVSYPAPSASGLLALDIDLDGHLDLAFPSVNGGTVTILQGRGDGTFDQRITIPAPLSSEGQIGFSPPRPGRGRDLLLKGKDAPIAVSASLGSLCPPSTGP